VTDQQGNRVQEFNSSGTYLGQIGCAGTNACSSSAANGQFNGQFNGPNYVGFGP